MQKVRNLAYSFLIRYRVNNLDFGFDFIQEVIDLNKWNLYAYSEN